MLKTDSFRSVSQITQREGTNTLGLAVGCHILQQAALRDATAKREPKLVTYIRNKLVMHHKRDSVIKTLLGTGTIDAECVHQGIQSKTTSLGELTSSLQFQ